MEWYGITETYDPSKNYSWLKYLKRGNSLITKNISDEFIEAVTEPSVQERCIIHACNTGMGGTILEPNVPMLSDSVNQFEKLLNAGFPVKQTVLRISPVIPTAKGINTMLKVLDAFKKFDIKRIRFSTINMYPHVKVRFREYGIPIPFETFSCPQHMRDNLMGVIKSYFGVRTNDTWTEDRCAEVDLDEGLILKRACVSQKDLQVLGIEQYYNLIGSGKQRSMCMCPDNKRQIIRFRGRCEHACKYCYYKGEPRVQKEKPREFDYFLQVEI